MKNFLEKTLRQNVMIEETEYLNEKLPLAFLSTARPTSALG